MAVGLRCQRWAAGPARAGDRDSTGDSTADTAPALPEVPAAPWLPVELPLSPGSGLQAPGEGRGWPRTSLGPAAMWFVTVLATSHCPQSAAALSMPTVLVCACPCPCLLCWCATVPAHHVGV